MYGRNSWAEYPTGIKLEKLKINYTVRVNNGFRAYDVPFIIVSQDDLADVDEKSSFFFLGQGFTVCCVKNSKEKRRLTKLDRGKGKIK